MAPRGSGKGRGRSQSSLLDAARNDQTASGSKSSGKATGQGTGDIRKIEPWGKPALQDFTTMVVDALQVYNEQWDTTALAQCPIEEQDECRELADKLCDEMGWELQGERVRGDVVAARKEFRDYEWRIVKALRFGGDPAKVGKSLMESIDYEETKRRRSRRVLNLAPNVVIANPVKLRPDAYIIDALLVMWESLSLRVNGSFDEMKSSDPFAILD
ncbi:hypothetical protein BJ166DRAFT_493782 [Pestalotiopsis sp. NC0098]|nr:hypothetical protein BJ166DRAFT_493782 [Pestalotiopsis sp. NC0098]